MNYQPPTTAHKIALTKHHQKGIVMMYSNNPALHRVIVADRHEQLRRSAAISRLRREARRSQRQRARSR